MYVLLYMYVIYQWHFYYVTMCVCDNSTIHSIQFDFERIRYVNKYFITKYTNVLMHRLPLHTNLAWVLIFNPYP